MSSGSDREERAKRVEAEFGGVHGLFEAFYIVSILYTARRCLAAFERYDQATKGQSPPEDVVDPVHEALTHAAALSRYFWPASRDLKSLAQARGRKLRDAFGIAEGAALEQREFRNALEHFDERLDAYFLGDLAGVFLPGPIVASVAVADDPVGHVFRLVDPTSETFVVFGEKVRFGQIRKEVADIRERAMAMHDRGGRLSSGHASHRD